MQKTINKPCLNIAIYTDTQNNIANMNYKISIICCWNTRYLFEKMRKSLRNQTISYNLISVDNTNQIWSSAASAYNMALRYVKTPYVIFVHQDIIFRRPDILELFVGFLSKIKPGDMAGAAGAGREQGLVTNVVKDTAGTPVSEKHVSGLEPCDILDECLFGGRTETFLNRGFDEKLCSGWHLYAAERCLYAKETGKCVYVCDLPVLHASDGTISSDYNRTFLLLSKRYHKAVPFLRTTCCYAPTYWPFRDFGYLYRWIKIKLGLYERKTM